VDAEIAQLPVPADIPALPVRSAELVEEPVCPALADVEPEFAAVPEVEPAWAAAESEVEPVLPDVDFMLPELEPALALVPAHDASTSEPE